jgi:N-acetyl-D-muramate 6-phosphate phosphatase
VTSAPPTVTPAVPAAAVLFDLDGTLLDTAPDLTRVLNQLRAEERLPPLPLSAVRPRVSHGASAIVRTGFPEADGERFERLRVRLLERYRSELVVDTRLFAGFDVVLAQLDAHGIPWGIVTNKPGWLTEPLLVLVGLRTRARSVISGDTLPVRKPDPLPLLTAARELGIAPARCLYLGDALRDAHAAHGAGMIAVGARFGYIDPHEDLSNWPMDGWIDAPLELLPWVGLTTSAPERSRQVDA